MANPRYIQAQSFALQSSGQSAGDTSITLQSFLLSDGVTQITTAMLGDQCYMTLEPNNGTQEEAIQFTGVTQNSNGTATLTGVSSVGFVYPYTVTSGLRLSHAGGVTAIISNDAALYGNIISYINGVVASGAPTATDTVAGLTKMTFNQGSNPRARSTLVSQSTSPGMNLLINSFSYQNGATTITFVGKTLDYINGVSSSTFVAPVSNPRYDLIVYRPSLTDCTSITGTEGASPALPTPTPNDIVLASIYHTVGETKLLERSDGINGYISIWYEPSIYLTASNITSDNITNGGADQSQTTENGTQAVGKSNLTGQPSIVAQKFVPTVPHIRGATLWKIADTGTFTGNVTINLEADSSGSPSGTILATGTLSNAQWLLIPSSEAFSVIFTSEYESMTDASPYWIVIQPSTSDNSNHPNLGINTAGGLTNGVLKYNNSTDGWVTVPTSDLYIQTLEGINSKIVSTNASGQIASSISMVKPVTSYVLAPVTGTYITPTPISIATSTFTTMQIGLFSLPFQMTVNKVKIAAVNNQGGVSGTVTFGLWSEDGTINYIGLPNVSTSVTAASGITLSLSSSVVLPAANYYAGFAGSFSVASAYVYSANAQYFGIMGYNSIPTSGTYSITGGALPQFVPSQISLGTNSGPIVMLTS